ncbi:phospholipase A and acyltransferase 4-like [Latimeria chalumnae]|uniref:phospholipase A and acyltransferase 4-like n=1 Tax=Latimeria chalumnae TaxID=7897 RepID=UPI0003C18886|nr:PREDICTED: retinoic acid receptor responder protein 3-like [Latimeria chalumnae]|eukprot:XP_005988962.1 PREDICTED: retinoic acid receptor responder protein 3-like [Latimeria chalumnae]
MPLDWNSSNPEPGDLIEFDRNGYKHWAVYVGQGYVVHLTGNLFSSSGGWSSSSQTSQAQVKKERLQDVVVNSRYRVKNKYDNLLSPKSPAIIVQDAESYVGMKVSYNILRTNCEHFATYLRYGRWVSMQVFCFLMRAAALFGILAILL